MLLENEQIDDKGYILNKLFPEYVSIYRIELNTGTYEILRLDDDTNAKKVVDSAEQPFVYFDDFARQYADTYVLEEEREEFLSWFACKNMKKQLQKNEKITYHYHSVSKQAEHRYYESYAVREKMDEKRFFIFLALRNIDSIVYKEKAIQEKLQRALEEARLSNEIISSIAKTYQYISRIDIGADYFEEIVNRDGIDMDFRRSGTLSQSNAMTCRNLVAEEYQDAFLTFTDLTTLPERMKEDETIALEYRMKDGNWHKLRFIEKKRDESGNLTHVLCVIRSISDTKKREQDLLYQIAEAKKENALKTRFLSNMSHDIRTPMNGILGMIDLANRYPDDLEMQKKCRKQIMESSRYLVSLVNDILDMSKLEAGEYIEQEITFDLTDLLSRANNEKQIQATEKGIEYVVDWDRAEIKHMYLSGNSIYLEKLLTAVTDNAVKFTKPGGSIHVWCAEQSVEQDKVIYEFGCSDNGIGMDENFVERAFDMFTQENETSRTQYEGAGLGLAIAKKITENLGGTIAIQSKKNVGTTVTMTIPFHIGQPKTIGEKVDYEGVSVEGLRVLVVEDNELNMEIAQFILENNHIQVECAWDGVEAVQKFETTEPGYYDAIYMDIMMPNLNGWDATRSIRSMKRPDAESVPIIAMSANAFVEDIINSRISGMNEHLTKPLDEEKLIHALKECIGKARQKI